MHTYSLDEVLLKKEFLLVDVRSPEEYEEDTVLGAINMPILDNEERKEVGYLYKQVDPFVAKRKGLEIASKKFLDYFDFVMENKDKYKNVVFFCYRGGLRSQTVAKTLSLMGLKVGYLKGGYKNYRQHVLRELPKATKKIELLGLQGLTGVGKTKILCGLKEQNIPILDLERYAQNSGSAFGSIVYAKGSYISQKKFESNLYEAILKGGETTYYVECESKRIGRVVQPEYFYKKLKMASRVLIETEFSNRVQIIYDDYVRIGDEKNQELLLGAVKSLNKRLGNKVVDELCSYIEKDEQEKMIEVMLRDYYDPLYIHSIEEDRPFIHEFKFDTIADAVEHLKEYWLENHKREEVVDESN
ncbi:MAG: tRNA 2-selenouridine(34) synthase MnmH [Tissierellales bacterium]|jgi:tRNA 2-selenouridine synthase|nr:tRNA 2-selenouridine(34) synthase MnmH [Tissierellales bacterium]